MTALEIESRTLRAVETALAGQQPEDSFVEFKREFTAEHNRTARRLAGLANAARGEPVLWIVGVDEATRTITGAAGINLSDWWAGVSGQFNELAPTMRNLSVPVRGAAVQALVFETDRAPFVVKNASGGGAISLEVPWREGTSARSARRSDLIGMLAPLIHLPDFEILDVDFTSTLVSNVAYNGTAKVALYVSPRDSRRVVFPFHKMRLAYERHGTFYPLPNLWVFIPHSTVEGRTGPEACTSMTIMESSSEIIVDGPGKFEVHANGNIPYGPETYSPLRVSLSLTPASATKPATLVEELTYSTPERSTVELWKLRRK